MNFKEIQELIRMVSKSDLSLFRIKDKDFELTIKTGKYTPPVVHQAPVIHHAAAAPVVIAPPTPVATAAPEVEEKPKASPDQKKYVEIRSPMVGTFYRSPGPDKGPFVKVGDVIDSGTTVCIIEAMKLFNEIESEVKGTIVKVLVDDSTPVEYDQVLFLIEP
ncbi:MAG: acetyl-CoA carboxylase biotin carboxyl carrier protein [Saprospiraceae bacterium]|nr:acetyl-CoA carboxylase biotin carboxyl carrier protein [Saprospiraceae bacterium]HMW40521.1 acetyl-CoA carboxylase biotin carboxyl carrier protein [Saprospiraceae bacterium]HMX87780.1 acetyl-CoA carboxylase biotin carboxyl carrier protein [Saprospiraceae bacterium]HMZ39356.1 acetyl-CoA carboxylase biotin carboxyl carrier protein [Saprospiraceae bacterium]HNA64290.1 acetyl-CoA carboxylase biotin carboxyl carrier protein [Saprospiraceae bacterium]